MKKKSTKACLLLLSLHLAGLQAVPALGLMAQEPAETVPTQNEDPGTGPEEADTNENASSDGALQEPQESEKTDQEETVQDADQAEEPSEEPAAETESTTDEKATSPFVWTDEGALYLKEDGTPAKGWFRLAGSWYYADPASGIIQTGEKQINGVWYYLLPEEDGCMAEGFVTIPAEYSEDRSEKTCYYAPGSGARQSGWVKVDGKTYNFLRSTGRQFFGEVFINGAHYYLNPEEGGAMARGFITIPARYSREGYEKTCYYNPSNGARKTGWVKVDGKSYNFYSVDGRQFFKEATINGVDYYLDPEDDGAVARGVTHIPAQYSRDGKDHCYFYSRSNGGRQSGWIYDGDDVYNFNTRTFEQVRGEANINGPIYFFDPADDGRMARGERLVPAALSDTGEDKLCLYAQRGYRITGWTSDTNGRRFWDPDTGALQTDCWLETGGNRYYMDENGYPLTGTHEIDGTSYTFSSTGALYTGWQKRDGKWYLYSDQGEILTGWQLVRGKWYWMDSNGVMAANRWIGDYYVLSDGAMATSRIIDNTWYVDHTGRYIKNGTADVNGRRYGFGPTGRMNYTAELDSQGRVTSLTWKSIAYYSQRDPRWANVQVGKYLFDGTGCGPTSAAMAMQTLYQKNYSPLDLGRYFVKTTTFNQAQPGMWGREFKVMDKDYGTNLTITKDGNMVRNALKNGDMVIIAVTRCLFVWDAEHFLVLGGYDDGTTFVRDSYTPEYNGQWYSIDYLLSHISDDMAIFRNPAVTAYH